MKTLRASLFPGISMLVLVGLTTTALLSPCQTSVDAAATAGGGGSTEVDLDVQLEDDMDDQGLALDTGERFDSLA